jgi:hypothetical protein
VSRTTTRLAVGVLAVALPLAAVAGCGAEKKRTIKAEFASAQSNLESSKAASFTLRFDDSKGTVAKLAKKDDTPAELVDALIGGSVTYVVDPAGDKTLKDLKVSGSTTAADLSAQLKTVNAGFVVRDDKSDLGEFRLIDGVLYAHVDMKAIGRLAKAGGTEDFDAQLDDFVDSASDKFRAGLEDVRAGKWIKLPLTDYIEKFQDLAQSFTGIEPAPTKSGVDTTKLGRDLFAAVKPHITVTDANNDSKDRVLDVKVKARPALKAALAVLQASKDLPFAAMLKEVTPAEIDKNVTDGTAKGTITMKSGHLSQFTVDVESIRLLSTDPGTDSVAGSRVVVDVDDSADQLKVPSDVSSFDVGALIDEFLQGMQGAQGQAGFSYSG